MVELGALLDRSTTEYWAAIFALNAGVRLFSFEAATEETTFA